MQKLLSLVLSFCILFSSVSPALAQRLPIKGGFRGLTRVPKPTLPSAATRPSVPLPRVSSLSGTRFASKTNIPAPAHLDLPTTHAGHTEALPGALNLTPRLQTIVEREYRKVSGNAIRAKVLVGDIEGVAEQILSHPKAEFRSGLLRNEFVSVSLRGGANAKQLDRALTFYRNDLPQLSKAFASLPQGDLSAVTALLKNKKAAGYQAVYQVWGAFADAGALGLLGAAEDAPLLLDFYEAAAQSVFKDVAAMVAARGLLRMGAYPTLEKLAGMGGGSQAFWQELARYAELNNLAVRLPSQAGGAAAESAAGSFLATGCLPNALNADASLFATKNWMELGRGPAASLAKVNPATLQVSLPAPSFTQPPLTLSALSLPETMRVAVPAKGNTLPAESAVSTPAATEAPSAAVGMLYGGLPVPEIAKAGKKLFNQAQKMLRKKAKMAPYEEPGLHDNSQIQEVYSTLRSPEAPATAAELPGAGETGPVPVAESGFKLTVVDGKGIERILPVNLKISNRFRVKGYNRVAFAERSDFSNGYLAELRNQEQKPLRMAHFYMKLQSNQVGALVDLVRKSGLENFRLKLEVAPDISYKTKVVPAVSVKGERLPLEVEIPVKGNESVSQLVLLEDGSLNLSGYYVRLPKNQIANLAKILPGSKTTFNVSIHPTSNRAQLILREASLTNVSLGKTMGPVVNGALDISVNQANSMMFAINYVLPGLSSLLTPILKKYGEKTMMTVALSMSTMSGVLATLGGFFGFVEGLTLTPLQKGLFITALFLMSGSGILKQLVSNMLIRANRGEAILNGSKGMQKEVEKAFAETPGFKHLVKRVKDVFTKKSDINLKDVVLYNLSFVYKNVGTLAFLATPFALNYGIKLITGVDLGLDYSISFPLYAGYSGWVTWKVYRAKLRDAYSAKDLGQSQALMQETLKAGSKDLAEAEPSALSAQVDLVARNFKDALDAFVFANVKLDSSKKSTALYKEKKATLLTDLEKQLTSQYAMPQGQAKELVKQVESSLVVQENTLGNMGKMLKAPGVAALTAAMTFATVHEFVISTSFSGAMKTLIPEGELANVVIAASLYGSFILGRLGGNVLSKRISPDSMYITGSVLSATGTAMMALAGGSVPQMIAGAAVASLGTGNFFTQMYDYIMTRYPKQNRELSSILALTMAVAGLAAMPAGYLASLGGLSIPLDLTYAGAALGASLILTPGMMRNSTLVQSVKYEGKRLWNFAKDKWRSLIGKKGSGPNGNLDDAAPAN